MTAEEYQDHRDNYDGLCQGCGEWSDGGVEPDATNYECPTCGENKVFGAEEALMMGLIEIEDD